ncbi:hypothetical protein, partial [Bacillus litorisediminis]|uniref:hypothetical protein n=1 Tax=Bacillus litorisediminis TaxID=2922713 RepID=UPI001FAF89EB
MAQFHRIKILKEIEGLSQRRLSQVFVGSFFLPNNESEFTILGYSLDKKFIFFKIRPTPLKS